MEFGEYVTSDFVFSYLMEDDAMDDTFFNFEAARKCEAGELNIDKDTFERRCYEAYQLHWMQIGRAHV